MRSEALKKAQKKYLQKIKEEKGERYEKYKESLRKYQRKAQQKIKENPILYEQNLKRNREYQRRFYNKYKSTKKENFLLNLPELEEEFNYLFVE